MGLAAPWCTESQRAQCIRSAIELATRLRDRSPDQCVGYALHARALVASGDSNAGLAELERAADKVSDRTQCLRQLVALAAKADNGTMVESALERIVHAGCTDPRDCVQNLLFVAFQEETRGRERSALALYKRAYEQAPDDNTLAQMARLAAANQAQWATAAAAEREAALREML